jgi:glycosyltransferase involved in cell wall biosynthesis
MKGIFVSVIVPNRNGEKTIGKTIESAEKSLEGNRLEIIVVDDASQDRSAAILEKISESNRRISFFQNKRKLGAAFSRNIGILNATGDVLLFIDNDVFLKEDCGSVLAKSAFSNNGISFPKIIFPNGRLMWPDSAQEEKYPGISACFAVKKSALKKIGQFDSNYETYLEDSDFFMRSRALRIKANYEEKAVALHLISGFYSAERRYFLENRNLVYGMLKFRKIKPEKRGPFTFSSLMKNLVCGIFNFRWFDWSHYDRNAPRKEKFRMLWKSHEKISALPGIFLFFIFFWSVFSGIFHYLNGKRIKFINRS